MRCYRHTFVLHVPRQWRVRTFPWFTKHTFPPHTYTHIHTCEPCAEEPWTGVTMTIVLMAILWVSSSTKQENNISPARSQWSSVLIITTPNRQTPTRETPVWKNEIRVLSLFVVVGVLNRKAALSVRLRSILVACGHKTDARRIWLCRFRQHRQRSWFPNI